MLKGLISNLADTTLAATEPPLLAAAGTTTRATYRQRTANEFRETGHGLEWTIWRSGQDSECFQLEASDQLWTNFQTKIMLKAIAVKRTKLAWGLSKF